MRGFTVAVGVFDGLHIGHRKLLEVGKKLSRELDTTFYVLSFIYPFEYYFNKEDFPGLLYTPSYRSAQLYNCGASGVFFLDLIELKDLRPDDFILLLKENGVRGIVVGSDFKFGKNASGNVELLKKLCDSNNMKAVGVPPVEIDGTKVSSSWIRSLVMEGNVRKAAKLLGSPYKITGEVVRGRRLGSELGFPTANIDRGHERLVVPKFGVYLTKVRVKEDEYFGIMNIGLRPTVEETEEVKYEVHIIEFPALDLYEEKIEVELLEYMRPEFKFESLEELKKAMEEDLERAKNLIQNWRSNPGRNE